MKSLHHKINKTKTISLAILGALVLIALYLLIAWYNHLPPFSRFTPTAGPGTHFTNMDKTDTEKQAANNLKKNPQEKTQNNQTDTPATPPIDTTSGKQQANVLITNAGVSNGSVSVSGFVTNVVESNGSCTYTFTNGSSKVSKTTNVLPNATSTTCATTTFPASDLEPSGTWSVLLSYSSSQSTGISPPKEFQK